jgi:uroporphyrinogen-III synthase
VLHLSRRSAELFVEGARASGVAGPAEDVRHLCLSAQVAEPLAGASRVTVAARPEEAALIALLRAPPA